jgi:two-component system chemotaxis response regulator CheB
MEKSFKIVAFGLSAGGMNPLLEILEGLPAELNAALVVIMHLPINASSKMHEILKQKTTFEVIGVSTIELVEPGKLYVMDSGKELVLQNGFLEMHDRNPESKINKTINTFFRSLAKDAGSRSIGVILSGAGYDGLEGAREIEDAKGIVIVQDPETAQFPLMPKNLIANDHPDYVLTPKDIADKLAKQLA